MAKKTTQDGQESDQENLGKLSSSNKGCSRFARASESSSINEWLDRKEKGPVKSAKKSNSRQLGSGSKSLKSVSKKQQKKNLSYASAKIKHYHNEDNQKCFLCECQDNLSVHHKAKRGNLIDDASMFVTLCLVGNYMDLKYPDSNHSHQGGCHSWVEANKSIAREMKLIL